MHPPPLPSRVPRQLSPTPHRPAGGETSERLGQHRWVVERTLAWLSRARRLPSRYQPRAHIHTALAALPCALAGLNQIRRLCWVV